MTKPGTFEYIDEQIRKGSVHELGRSFERLCKFYLENSPKYRGEFKQVWHWKDWPRRWGPDTGIDLIAETTDGEIWAIQAKGINPERSIPKRELDSFLSDSNRPEIKFRLIIATTDDIGANARRTIESQQIPVGFVLRGDLLGEELVWPEHLGEQVTLKQKKTPRPHQEEAITDVLAGFGSSKRGKLILACGTGKTLTALWIKERLQSKRTLFLVPSLSLVNQTLLEWGANAGEEFERIVVCSDDTVTHKGDDHAVASTADLGIEVTTDPRKISHFFQRQHDKPVVVFCTYQSSDRIVEAHKLGAPAFDLVIADEAHRTTGYVESNFATVLDDQKIKSERRLFMTATPRYFTDRVLDKSKELEYEMASMDDEDQYGPLFHQLSFGEAIKRDLLSDYQVVVISASEKERKMAEDAILVRTADGLTTDARTFAAQVGLAKAIKKYDLHKVITFHSSVAKAQRFADSDIPDSLPSVIDRLPAETKPAGEIWTSHISGHTPTGRRKTLLSQFAAFPNSTRAILTNCACLGEGVDVPTLDGVAFIDPKRSQVDIIQAVGRVIRKAHGVGVGTIVIPVFIDESEDEDTVLSSSAFKPVWQVIKALRAHDETLADELDEMRLKLGARSVYGGKVKLPDSIKVDIPTVVFEDFERAFSVRTIEATTKVQWLPFEEAQQIVCSLHLESQDDWYSLIRERPKQKELSLRNIPNQPDRVYKGKGWTTWGDWLGTGRVQTQQRRYRPFPEARDFIHTLGLKNVQEWWDYARGRDNRIPCLPTDIPAAPERVYENQGWRGIGDWIGTDRVADQFKVYRDFNDAKKFVQELKLLSQKEWFRYCKGEMPHKGKKPEDIPAKVSSRYKNKGWISWGDFLGTGYVYGSQRSYLQFEEAKQIVHKMKFANSAQYFKEIKNRLRELNYDENSIPYGPHEIYKGKGWRNWGDFLGTGWVDTQARKYKSFTDARAFARSLKLTKGAEWNDFCKGNMPEKGVLPPDIPLAPDNAYKNKGWISWGDFLGTGRVADFLKVYRSFDEARKYAQTLKLNSYNEWISFCHGKFPEKGTLPQDIPISCDQSYKDNGWTSWGDFLGTGNIPDNQKVFREFHSAREFVKTLGLKNIKDWEDYKNTLTFPVDLPRAPGMVYKHKGWLGWGDFLGTGRIAKMKMKFLEFEKARAFAHSLGIQTVDQWYIYHKAARPANIPSNPSSSFKDKGWQGWSDWLGTPKKSRDKQTQKGDLG